MKPAIQKKFLQAAKSNNTKELIFFLTTHRADIDLNGCDSDNKSALFYVIKHGNKTAFQTLLKLDADIQRRFLDENGIERNLLYFALTQENLAQSSFFCEILLRQGISFNEYDEESAQDYLDAAAKLPDFSIFLILIEIFKDQDIVVDTYLFEIICGNQFPDFSVEAAEVICKLIEYVPAENWCNLDEIFSCLTAVTTESAEIKAVVINEFLNKGIGFDVLTPTSIYEVEHIQRNDYPLLKILLAAGVHPDKKNKDEFSALLNAIRQNNIPVVQLLLEHHADPNQLLELPSQNNNFTCLGYATFCQRYDVIALLLKHHVDVNKADNKGNTALHYALYNKDKIAVELLLSRDDIDLTIKNNEDMTAMTLLVQEGFYEYLEKRKITQKEVADVIYQNVESTLGIHFLNQSHRNKLQRFSDFPVTRNTIKKLQTKWLFGRAILKHQLSNKPELQKKYSEKDIQRFESDTQEIKQRFQQRLSDTLDHKKQQVMIAEKNLLETLKSKKIKLTFQHASNRAIQGNELNNASYRNYLSRGPAEAATGMNLMRGGNQFIFGWLLAQCSDDVAKFPEIVLSKQRVVYIFDVEKILKYYDLDVKGNNGNYFDSDKMHILGELIHNVHIFTEIRARGGNNSGKAIKKVIAVNEKNQRYILPIEEREQVFSGRHGGYQQLVVSLALDILHRYVKPIKELSIDAAYKLLYEFTDDFAKKYEDHPEIIEETRLKSACHIFNRSDIREATLPHPKLSFVHAITQEKLMIKSYRTLNFSKEDLTLYQQFLLATKNPLTVDINIGKQLFDAIENDDIKTFKAILDWYKQLPEQIMVDDVCFYKAGLLDSYYEKDENKFGTPLTYATRLERIDMVKDLIACGANIDGIEKVKITNLGLLFGVTPLSLAAYNEDTKMVAFLLEKGANTAFCIDDEGINNALTIAEETGNQEIINLLLTHGARYPNGIVPHSENANCNNNNDDGRITIHWFMKQCQQLTTKEKNDLKHENIIATFLRKNFLALVQAIIECSYLKPYSRAEDFSFDPVHKNFRQKDIAREYHGGIHAVRVFLSMLFKFNFINLFGLKETKKFSENDLLFTLIAGLFHDAARKGEGKDQWEKQSAKACYNFLIGIGLSKARAKYFSDSILHENADERIFSPALLIQAADCNEVARVRDRFIINYSGLLNWSLDQFDCDLKQQLKVQQQFLELMHLHLQFIQAQGDLLLDCDIAYQSVDRDGNKSYRVLFEKLKANYDIDRKKQFEHADNCMEETLKLLACDKQFELFCELLDKPHSSFIADIIKDLRRQHSQDNNPSISMKN